jgi:hypothetical protein
MNLLEFLIPPTTEKPARIVTDYSAVELAKFKELYRPLVTYYRRRTRLAHFGMGAFFLPIILGILLPKSIFIYLWFAGICSWFFVVFVWIRVPPCPSCHNPPDCGFGIFCPECGSRTLDPSDSWFSNAPHCRSCDKSMRQGKARRYTIRFCTHCELTLDEKGL